ncbi:MAG TPA: hypothetical protein VGK13_02495, partial [Methanocellaceae archaeon]
MIGMRAWFGKLGAAPEGRTAVELSKWAASADSEGIDKTTDFETLATTAKLCSDFKDYRRLLHETAVSVAKEQIKSRMS